MDVVDAVFEYPAQVKAVMASLGAATVELAYEMPGALPAAFYAITPEGAKLSVVEPPPEAVAVVARGGEGEAVIYPTQ